MQRKEYEILTRHVHFGLKSDDEKLASILDGVRLDIENFQVTDAVMRKSNRLLHDAGYEDIRVQKGGGRGLPIEITREGELIGTASVITDADDRINDDLLYESRDTQSAADNVRIGNVCELDDFRKDSERKLRWSHIEILEGEAQALRMFDPEKANEYLHEVRLDNFHCKAADGREIDRAAVFSAGLGTPETAQITRMSNFTNDLLETCQDAVGEIWDDYVPGDDPESITVAKGADNTNKLLFLRDGVQVGSADVILTINDTYEDMPLPGGKRVNDLDRGNAAWSDIQSIEDAVREQVAAESFVGKHDAQFKEMVQINISTYRKSAEDHITFPKQAVEISSIANIRSDIEKAIKNALVKNAPVLDWREDPLEIRKLTTDDIDVQICKGKGLPANLWRNESHPDGFTNLGNAKIEVQVIGKFPETHVMPNGETYDKLASYNWAGLKRLEDSVKNFEFDFNNIRQYAMIEFNSPDFNSNLLHDMSMQDRDLRMTNFSDSVLNYARYLATAECPDGEDGIICVKKGEGQGLPIEIYYGDKLAGTAYAEVAVQNIYSGERLPNGDKVSRMQFYGWEDFEDLERMAREQEEVKRMAREMRDLEQMAQEQEDLLDFEIAVASLSSSDNGQAR